MLFDQNISFRVVKILGNHFSGSEQVRQLNLEGARDKEIWEFAKVNNFVVVTFDADFYDFSNLYGHPPKIIWLRTGNTTTLFIANLLIQKEEQIIKFLEDKEVSCLEIY
nr:DUF5615 family PIN-like protein [Pedobacter sp. SYSU D00535]